MRRLLFVALDVLLLAANLIGGPLPSVRMVVSVLAAVLVVLAGFLVVVLVLGMAAQREPPYEF